MSLFSISITGQNVSINLQEEMLAQDVIQMMTFQPDQIDSLLQNHAGVQVYWEALAIKMKSDYDNFKESFYKKWWAHSNNYARNVLCAYGDAKPTGVVVSDMVIQIYSSDTTPEELAKYAAVSFQYLVRHSKYEGTQEDYSALMFKYLSRGWTFEMVTQRLQVLKDQSEYITAIAERLNSKAYNLTAYARLHEPKRGNM
jgi:hypothetical protein